MPSFIGEDMPQLIINTLHFSYMQELDSKHYYLFAYDIEQKLEFKIAHLDDSHWQFLIEEYQLTDAEIEQITLFFIKNIILKNTNNSYIERT